MKNKNKLFSPIFIAAVVVIFAGSGFMFLGNNGGRALSLDYFLFWKRSPQLWLYNLTEPSRNPLFWTGDRYRLAVSLKQANQSVQIKSCWIFIRRTDDARSVGCSDLLPPFVTDTNGAWHHDDQVIGISVGTWIRWLEINGKRTTTRERQKVVCDPNMPAENCPK